MDGKASEPPTASRCTFNDAVARSFSQNKSFGGNSFVGGRFTAPLNRDSVISDKPGDDEAGLSDIGNFSYTFWIICGGCVVVYATVLPFNNIASGFLGHKFYPGLIDVPKEINASYKENAVGYANTWMMVTITNTPGLSKARFCFDPNRIHLS